MGFNPLRIFKRSSNWGSSEGFDQWDKPPTNRRRVALIAVGAAVGLFALALLLLSGPSSDKGKDNLASQEQRKSLVASDSQDNPNVPIPNVLARQKVSAAECSQRRLQLTGDSQTVDRFDLKALAALNQRIGLYNEDCADTNTTAAAQKTQPDPTIAAKAAATAQQTGTPTPTKTVAKPSISAVKTEPPKKELITTNKQGESADRPKWNPTVLSIQSLLKKQGFDPGPTDGLMGRKTRDAVKAFQTKHGLTPDGLVTLELLEQVLEAHPSAGEKSTFSPAKKQQVVKKQTAPKAGAKALSSAKDPVGKMTKTAVNETAKPSETPAGTLVNQSSKKLTTTSGDKLRSRP